MGRSRKFTLEEAAERARLRNERTLTLDLRDRELKDKLFEVAKHDSRSVNAWVAINVLPDLEQFLDERLAVIKGKSSPVFGKRGVGQFGRQGVPPEQR
jgi:hypothetical protein